MSKELTTGKKKWVLMGRQMGKRVRMPIYMFRDLTEATDPRDGYGDFECMRVVYLN